MKKYYWELPDKLPAPDNYGNYYLADKPLGPTIFLCGTWARRNPKKTPRWLASLGHDGMLWERVGDNKRLIQFNSVQEAFLAIREALVVKGECDG